ncbi:MAG TPA: primosomal protein N' [Bacteroidales bacterium]|nr:primosomal protein N' [Bacteroidales bacterium]
MDQEYADIILPLAVRGRFTYRIPGSLKELVVKGIRVKVHFNNKLYPGIVCELHNNVPVHGKIKDIISVYDNTPLINDSQLRLWKWISDYYMCTEGEVMKAGLLPGKSINDYKNRTETFIAATSDSEDDLNICLDKLKKAPAQLTVLENWIRLSEFGTKNQHPVKKQQLLKESDSSESVVNSLIKKKILKSFPLPVSRIDYGGDLKNQAPHALSKAQDEAYRSIRDQFLSKDIVLLHGVTSSGKTEIYVHLIAEQLKKGKQVLYLLPEIALTTQIIQRLKKHFGNSTAVYHSKLNDAERIEIWQKVADSNNRSGIILGVRSAIFLPFSNLGLVITDEEHDSSYKQQDPAPRYHARDTAIMLASIHGAKTLLGSASPSIESFYNATTGKYGLVTLAERFGQIRLPDIILANTREAYRKKMMVSHFTPELLYSIDNALGKGEQVILFQNRRGFAPYIECSDCGWIPSCVQCAVNLTYHKGINKLICHYCGFSINLPHNCGSCNSAGLTTKGFGTEKIEDEIKIIFPAARIARMDQDTTRSKNAFNKIIKAFEERQIDILVGTQMISKGLDFENLTIVGILNADNMLNYPDFRAHERSFQLMEQVSGRAGRRKTPGKVIIQTSDPLHRIVRLVLRHDYVNMYRIQAEERKTFNYPPFCRIIKLIIKHKDRGQVNYFSEMLAAELKKSFGKNVLGPDEPVISKVQFWYIKVIMLKTGREISAGKTRSLIYKTINIVESEKGASGLRLAIDVDPY